MNWGNPKVLYALLTIPVFVVLLIISGYLTKKRFNRFAESRFYDFFMKNYSAFHWHFKGFLLLLPLALLIIAAARPQWGQEVQLIHKEGLDIVICIDVSLSMKAADIRPNRLQRAKDQISYFLDRLKGDRVALVPFAGTSFVNLPMTDDYQAAKLFLSLLDTDSVPLPGTNIGNALLTAEKAFPDPDRNKVIIMISDGEDLEEEGIEVAKGIGERGIVIHTIGIGSPDGSPLMIKTPQGNYEYAKDQSGNIVISRLDVNVLSSISRHGNGKFFLVTPHQAEIYEILRSIEELEKGKYDAKEYVRYQERYRFFAFLALIIILLESLLLYRKKRL